MIKFKLIHKNAKMPTRAKPGDAGFDLCAISEECVFSGCRELVETGIACAIPEGYVGIVKPRSGLAVKYGIDVMAGVIDSGYRGPLNVLIQNHQEESINFSPGDRIAQLVVVPYMGEAIQVDELDDTERGDGGFGSTGK